RKTRQVRVWRARPRSDHALLLESRIKPAARAGQARRKSPTGTREAIGKEWHVAARIAEARAAVSRGTRTPVAAASRGIPARRDWGAHRRLQQEYECDCRCSEGCGALEIAK